MDLKRIAEILRNIDEHEDESCRAFTEIHGRDCHEFVFCRDCRMAAYRAIADAIDGDSLEAVDRDTSAEPLEYCRKHLGSCAEAMKPSELSEAMTRHLLARQAELLGGKR